MANSERRKGQTGEREVVDVFRSHRFDVDRTPNSGALRLRGDLYGTVPVHVEVKRQEVARTWLWAEQASTDAGQGERWLVAMRRSRSPWLALLPLDDVVRLLELERLATELVDLGEAVGSPAFRRLAEVVGQ